MKTFVFKQTADALVTGLQLVDKSDVNLLLLFFTFGGSCCLTTGNTSAMHLVLTLSPV